LHELKIFLKTNHEAEEYENVDVKFIPHKPATLTISVDGAETEKVDLEKFQTRQELHNLFSKKGFKRKSKEDIRAMKDNYNIERMKADLAHEEERKELRAKMRTMHESRKVLPKSLRVSESSGQTAPLDIKVDSPSENTERLTEEAMMMGTLGDFNEEASNSSVYLFQILGVLFIALSYKHRKNITSFCCRQEERKE